MSPVSHAPCEACAPFAGGNPCIHRVFPYAQVIDEIFATMDGNVKYAQAVAYAWGYSDASDGIIPVGSYEFGIAYATAWLDFEAHRGPAHMIPVQHAYQNWLRTKGETIWDDGEMSSPR